MKPIPHLQVKQESLTTLEKEKQNKLKAGEFVEEIDATGQEDEEKAAKWVKEVNKQTDLKSDIIKNDLLTFLEDHSHGKIKTYELALENLTISIMKMIDFPPRWDWEVGSSIRGVAVRIRRPDGEIFGRGFKPIHEQRYDLHAINVLIMQVENTIQSYEQSRPETSADSGDQKDGSPDQKETSSVVLE
jgi:hypothetical protein